MIDISKHIEKTYLRLHESEYAPENIIQSGEYTWPGDWEGRALLALCNIYELTGDDKRLKKVFSTIKSGLNSQGFFGEVFNPELISEQQLSGHSWLMRGFLEYYACFDDAEALSLADKLFNNLYYPSLFAYDKYPLMRTKQEGDVSGNISSIIDGWELSTDIGCAFMCIDGLSHYYEVTKNTKTAEMLEKLIEVFLSIDLVENKVQTHATLSATRGMIRYYKASGKEYYLDLAKKIFNFYLENGMTDTYENFNWFGRLDTWTEPCAIVDSFMVSDSLYKITGEKNYLTLARRIWLNGLSYCHRDNGGAGPNKCVTEQQKELGISMYEATCCCTMRYAEGLLTVKRSEKLYNSNGTENTVDEKGRKFVGDALVVKDEKGKEHLLCDLAFTDNNNKKFSVYF